MIAEGRELADDRRARRREGAVHARGRPGRARRWPAKGIRVNVTLIFSPTQALFAAKVGAAYVSPFVGRLDDIATDGMGLIQQIVEIFGHFDFGTEMLVASVRRPMHIVEAARMGADVCTCPAAVIEACFKHPLTDIGLEKFLKDWEKAQAARAIAERQRDPHDIPPSDSPSSSASPSWAAARSACAGSTTPAS